jgi:Vitamin K-dependent gamma-carboxylase
MSLRSLVRSWNQFFFLEQSPLPIALFRVVYGLLVITTIALLRPDWLNWYGVHGWLSLSTALKLEPGHRLSLFTIIPQRDAWIEALFWVSLSSAMLLTLGLFTRINSILVFVCLTSIQQRNLYILHGGDTFLRLAGFFLIFSPAGAALSLDRMIPVWRGKESQNIRPRSPWAQRMIQLELSVMYLVSFLLKMKGAPWLQGTALFYVYHLDEFKCLPLPPWFFYPTVLKLGCWSALALELSLGLLIWVKELRYPLLALGLLFHLWLEFSLNIPMFQWDILSAYLLFIDANDLSRVWSSVRRSFSVRWRLSRDDSYEFRIGRG